MTRHFASALDDAPHGCGLLKQVIASKDVSTEGAVGRPSWTAAESVAAVIAQLRRPMTVRAFVVDLDVLGGRVD